MNENILALRVGENRRRALTKTVGKATGGRPMELQKISHYQIIRPLGAGGMGAVFLAEDTRLDRRVAIKFLPIDMAKDEKSKGRLISEARAAAKVEHPNICSIHEAIEEEPACIVMEYIEGETLSDRIHGHPLKIRTSLDLVIQLADALEELHSCGMIHRDIKPGNVIVTPRGRVKLLDFGLATMVRPIHGDMEKMVTQNPVTKAGSIVGTVAYMSPEQATGHSVDSRSDLFSLGTLLYECLTGKRPFSGTTAMEEGANVIYSNPMPPSHFNRAVPAELDRITLKLLAKKAEERYQSAGKLIQELRMVRDNLTGEGFNCVKGNSSESTGANPISSIVRQKRLGQPMISYKAIFTRACNRVGLALSLFI